MNVVTLALGILVAGVIGFLMSKKGRPHWAPHVLGNFSLFRTLQGSGGFCTAKIVEKRMKGRTFHWKRAGGCRPEPGSRFEIRLKDQTKTSPLIPEVPSGVDDIRAEVKAGVPAGAVYEYSLWQVLADGRERELDDPELEIGEI